jgi:hypothetical protein
VVDDVKVKVSDAVKVVAVVVALVVDVAVWVGVAEVDVADAVVVDVVVVDVAVLVAGSSADVSTATAPFSRLPMISASLAVYDAPGSRSTLYVK